MGGERILFIRSTFSREKYPPPRNTWPPITIGYMLSLAEAAGHQCKLIYCRVDSSSANGIVGAAASYKPSLIVILFRAMSVLGFILPFSAMTLWASRNRIST